MDVDKSEERTESRIALHPLTIVHMSDQYTRISCGGSPLDRNSPVVGLLFGDVDEQKCLQIRDADEIPTMVSEATSVQVNLHRAVFPQHKVVGWYRVSSSEDEPSPSDLETTQVLREHYALDDTFVFCLLQVSSPDAKPSSDEKPTGSLKKDLPIGLFTLHAVDGTSILLGHTNWQLETSEPEKIAVERVMKERPQDPRSNAYVSHVASTSDSMGNMQERVSVLLQFLQDTQSGKIPPNHHLLRQVQSLLYSLGPLSSVASTQSADEVAQDAKVLLRLAALANTISAAQDYMDKFRVVHEVSAMGKEMRQPM
eukprot:Nitzschia sp. Nitz4//scaffold170_size48074//46201//47228//NITZ4_007115-RA/size48074-augustus-gene-0.36-mRNA-1//-1//CDS//3329538670//3871//frame0